MHNRHHQHGPHEPGGACRERGKRLHGGGGQGDGIRPLASFPDGSLVRIVRVEDCDCPRCRVFALGLTPGTAVEIISCDFGPCRLRVRDSELVIGRGMAEKILAEADEPQPAPAE